MEILYIYCKECGQEGEIEIDDRDLGKGLPKGSRCPNPKCGSTNIVED